MDQQEAQRVFDYDPETGLLRWRIRVSCHNAGAVAGSLRGRYTVVRYEGRWFQVHRIIVLYMTGKSPPYVDHRNRNRQDNRWVNLRCATASQNAANRKTASTNKVGLKGVIRVTRYGVTKFEARLRIDGKQKHLGRFDTEQEAHHAYVVAAERHHGEFARGA